MGIQARRESISNSRFYSKRRHRGVGCIFRLDSGIYRGTSKFKMSVAGLFTRARADFSNT